MPRGSRKTQLRNDLEVMKSLSEDFIKINQIENKPNTLENQIKSANENVEFHKFYVENANIVISGCLTNPNDYKCINKSGKYLKSRARLLQKLQERRDKKK